MTDDLPQSRGPAEAARLDYESPQTRLNQRRPPPPQSVVRLLALAAVMLCGTLAFFASHREGDVPEGIGTTMIVVGLLLFIVEFVMTWWLRPR